MSLESDLKKYEKLTSTAKKAEEEAQTLMEGIKTRIKTGKETTGDKINDFVIYANGRANGDIIDAYNRLDERLKNKVNKQILVVNEVTEVKDLLEKHYMAHDDDDEKKGFMPPFKNTVKTETLRLGVLLEDCLSFDLETQKFAFPVGKHALQFDKGRGKWKLVEENISFHAYEILLLDEKLQKEQKKHDLFSFLHGNSCTEKLSVYIDEEVEKYFSEPKIDPEDYFSELKPQKMDLSYIDALKLLNLEVPKKFLDAYQLQEEKEKTALVKKIEELVSAKLSTDDDEKKVHIGCIKSNLEKALKMGLDLSNIVLPGRTKGVTIKVSDYITDLCKQYGVEAPK